MDRSIGLIELKSIPTGVETADVMLKAANVDLIMARPTCPGKYVIIITGNVGAVKNSMSSGISTAGYSLVNTHIINNVDQSLPAAIMGTTDVDKISAIGAVETISAITSVIAGDIAAKASNVKLIEIRIANGLGGKGFLIFTGEVSAVKSAMKSIIAKLGQEGEITSTTVIPAPHKNLIPHILG
ncbi:MAG: BMC domain-containing protein [Peptostreptococcaceae bacterium]|nr:BMC domain-containing protein [Peptostreptococcaceae bacterium]